MMYWIMYWCWLAVFDCASFRFISFAFIARHVILHLIHFMPVSFSLYFFLLHFQSLHCIPSTKRQSVKITGIHGPLTKKNDRKWIGNGYEHMGNEQELNGNQRNWKHAWDMSWSAKKLKRIEPQWWGIQASNFIYCYWNECNTQRLGYE